MFQVKVAIAFVYDKIIICHKARAHSASDIMLAKESTRMYYLKMFAI